MSARYWDAGDVRGVDGELELVMLEYFPIQGVALSPDGQSTPLPRKMQGDWRRVRADCDWGVVRDVARRAWTVDPAEASAWESTTGEPEFFTDHSPASRVCRPGFSPPADAIQSVPQVTKAADAAIPPMTVLLVGRREEPTPVIAIGAPSGPAAYGLVAVTPTERAAYVDWAHLKRDGFVATADTLWILGPETGDDAANVALREIRFDCREGTAEIVVQQVWSRLGEFQTRSQPISGARPVEGLPTLKALWTAACTGQRPAETFADIDAALAKARAGWRRAPPPLAPPTPPPPPRSTAPLPIVTNPEWIRKPGAEDLARLFPPAALEAGIEGRSTIECLVTAEGSLTNCVVVSEAPPGAGFGAAHIEAARLFRMRPKTKEGVSVEGGSVRITLVWGLS